MQRKEKTKQKPNKLKIKTPDSFRFVSIVQYCPVWWFCLNTLWCFDDFGFLVWFLIEIIYDQLALLLSYEKHDQNCEKF